MALVQWARYFVVVGLVLAASCGGSDVADTTTTSLGPTTTITGATTTRPVASSTTSVEVGLPDLVGDWDNGEAFLQIADDGSYQVLDSPDSDRNDPVMGGFVARDGANINFVTDLFGECAGVTGVYSVTIEDGEMTLTLVDDPCELRAASFTEPWEAFG